MFKFRANIIKIIFSKYKLDAARIDFHNSFPQQNIKTH